MLTVNSTLLWKFYDIQNNQTQADWDVVIWCVTACGHNCESDERAWEATVSLGGERTSERATHGRKLTRARHNRFALSHSLYRDIKVSGVLDLYGNNLGNLWRSFCVNRIMVFRHTGHSPWILIIPVVNHASLHLALGCFLVGFPCRMRNNQQCKQWHGEKQIMNSHHVFQIRTCRTEWVST